MSSKGRKFDIFFEDCVRQRNLVSTPDSIFYYKLIMLVENWEDLWRVVYHIHGPLTDTEESLIVEKLKTIFSQEPEIANNELIDRIFFLIFLSRPGGPINKYLKGLVVSHLGKS